MTVTTLPLGITGGVDTHLDVHVAAALDDRGALLGVESFDTTEGGYKKLLAWLSDFGPVELVGVEGTGSYGAGLTRHLQAERVRIVEVDRPNRQRRRRKGKSDPQDAISAARAAQSGDASGEAKSRDGNVESMRVLRVARASARKGRTQALNQMRGLISTAPEPIRAELRGLNVFHLLERASTRNQTRHRLAHQVHAADAGPAGHHPRRGDL
jgi:transposase